MATPDHTEHSQAYQPSGARPSNPLGRPNWKLTLAENARQTEAARLGGLCLGIHALSRILANSDVFRELQTTCESTAPGFWPLQGDIIEGLFAALYFLGEEAESLTQSLPGHPAFE
ncbi:hypothetical protein [Dyella humicola]|uniref:hypothetical protein n=1 Tax=Dyella humicola TaxID=2992126 RepID=UPI0022502556|nr:hypothetical protein [Dyella humicola]